MPVATYTGAPWRGGLPPGVYEDRPQVISLANVRMDVAAFVGLTERGPVATPVAVDGWDAFRECFGDAGGNRLLPQSVYLFFANGGRRCVVIRALNYGAAATASWPFAGLADTNGRPLRLFGRNPGAWSNRLTTTLRFQLLPARLRFAPAGSILRTGAVAGSSREVVSGTLYRFLSPAHPEAIYGVAQSLGATAADRLIVLDQPTALPAQDMLTDDLVASVREVRVRLDVHLDGRLVETWDDAALHPEHPRFIIGLIGRRAKEEVYLGDDELQPPVTAAEWMETSRVDALLQDADRRRAGSSFVRPIAASWAQSLRPAPRLGDEGAERPLQDGLTVTSGPMQTAGSTLGSDGAQVTRREHFFLPPRASVPAYVSEADCQGNRTLVFIDRPAPLDALATYDARNETEPVSLVHLPDLAHPVSGDVLYLAPPAAPVAVTCFRPCEPQPVPRFSSFVDYPELSITDLSDLQEINTYQQQVIEWCSAESRRDRVAILDLPPGLSAGGIAAWRRDVASDRATLYAPYLRCAPAEDPEAPLIVVPPGGAVCGIIARRERERRVHVAPANVAVQAIVGLFEDPSLPDAGFLHQERINAVGISERGFDLLGSRTTSTDPAWIHISVRRLVDYLKRQLALDARWAVFEPNNSILWDRLIRTAERRLRPLFDTGAFAGRTADESYFIRCDRSTHTQTDLDFGRVVVLVGVAPSVPAEFIVFRLSHQGDGEVTTEDGLA